MATRTSRRETSMTSSTSSIAGSTNTTNQTRSLSRERVRTTRSLSSSRVASGSRGSNLDVSRISGGGKGDDRITLNVGGVRYQTTKSTLMRVPNSVLTELAENALRTEETGVNYEYFFDRSPGLFSCILDYYRLKELHLDHAVCPKLLKQELEFWKIPESALADCCWAIYAEFFDKQRTRSRLEQASFYVLRGARAEKFKLFILSLRAASREINLFVALLFIATIVFGLIIRLVESSEIIGSIPSGIYWAFVTMCTVGYGHSAPQSAIGISVGICCALFGVILVAGLMPLLGIKFKELSDHYEAIKRIRRRDQHRGEKPEANGKIN